MKTKLHLIIIIAAIVIIVVGIVSAMIFLKPKPENVLKDSFAQQIKIPKYKITYDLNYSVKSGGFNINANGNMEVSKNNNITKVSMLLDAMSEKMRIEQYQTPTGIIQCTKSLFNTTC